MAQNLNYDVGEGSLCYDNDSANCAIYGHLYNWSTARHACPTDWHIPTLVEWNVLWSWVTQETGDTTQVDLALKVKDYGASGRLGTDLFGFRVIPAGQMQSSFSEIDIQAYLGMADTYTYDTEYTQVWDLYPGSGTPDVHPFSKENYMSIRCLRDD